uniref:Tick transposon n=1 Tax=Rhipicephalus pulchellus TaxID=72859 RepID=L7LW05_RHIPC
MSAVGFLELLTLYLTSTFIEWSGKVFLQKEGVCICSYIAPILSYLFLASIDRHISRKINDAGVLKMFHFVDDYLILYEPSDASLDAIVSCILCIFSKGLEPLVITHVLPQNNEIKFLDLRIRFSDEVCWMYEPRGLKPLLPYQSAHTKLVKRAIVESFLESTLKKSCPHLIKESFRMQIKRLDAAGYPQEIITAVAEVLHRKINKVRGATRPEPRQTTTETLQSQNKRFAVIPYYPPYHP